VTNLKAIDLFCGAGGASIGLAKAGIDIVGAVDAEESPVETYEHNLCTGEIEDLPGSITFDSPFQADLSRGRSDEYEALTSVDYFDICDYFGLDCDEVDLICGCPPCQNYSSLRDTEPWDEDDPKELLLETYVEFIREAVPDYVFFENVPGILTAGEDEPSAYVDWFLGQMSEITRDGDSEDEGGYGVEFQLVNAADYGVPQKRKRTIGLFVYGADDDEVEFPQPTHAEEPSPNSNQSEWVTVEDAILRDDDLRVELALGEKQTGTDNLPHFPDHRARQHHDRTVKRAKRIREFGDSWRDLEGTEYEHLIEDCHDGLSDGAHSAYGIMAKDEPAPTLTTKCTTISSGRFTHPTQNRSITLREAARLMTFPDWFEFPGSHGASETVVGNAVPAELVASIWSRFAQSTENEISSDTPTDSGTPSNLQTESLDAP